MVSTNGRTMSMLVPKLKGSTPVFNVEITLGAPVIVPLLSGAYVRKLNTSVLFVKR